MAKKRKARGKPFGQASVKEIDPSDAKLRINSYEDVADSEDEFNINRDKILLEEGPARKRQRKIQEADAFLEPSDEEVLAESASRSDSEAEDDDEQDHTDELGRSRSSNRSLERQGSESEDSARPEDDEDVGGWGTSKRDYYDADIIETEADALEEEEEALRLQKKQLQGMTEADYGFDEIEWLDAGNADGQAEDGEQEGVIRKVLPQLEITDSMGPEERRKILNMRYPEFEPLAKEYLDLQSTHEELQLAMLAVRAVEDHQARSARHSLKPKRTTVTSLHATIKHSALTAYLAALSMYFAVITSGVEDENGKIEALTSANLRDHPIMESLMRCRELWQKLRDLKIPDRVDTSGGIDDLQSDLRDSANLVNDRSTPVVINEGQDATSKTKNKTKRKSKAQRAAEAAILEADLRRKARLEKTEEELAKLTALTSILRKPSKPKRADHTQHPQNLDEDSDFGEETTLTVEEAAEKAKRKKSLRFYTSRITQKANSRENAGRDAGGDIDIPYRERLRDRQDRLNNEAEARGRKTTDANSIPLGGESDEEDRKVAKEIRDGGHGEEDYYELVSARSREKKVAKVALAAAHQEADRQGGIVRVVEGGADGKRAIGYAIEKNKGLAPKRKKDVRNPRVKKRKKYEDKKKKLGSIRPVYKGGEGRGGYGGELTGIKKGLIRSVKL